MSAQSQARPQPHRRSTISASIAIALVVPLSAQACKSETPPEPMKADTPAQHEPTSKPSATQAAVRPKTPSQPRARVSAKPVASVPVTEDDPLKGKFTLADATKDVKGQGALLADIEVEIPGKGSGSKGEGVKLTCALFEDRAPITVANFVGLAKGTRSWKNPDGKWVQKPAYDGTIFHRIIKGFMIQGGDPAGNGTGEPGYVIPDEIWEGADHDRAGLLCMANRGKNTNGAQFFITDAPAPHLDNGYTIFGECAPVDAVHKIAGVDVRGEKPAQPPKIKKITVRRGQSPVPLPSASGSASATSPASAAPSGSAPPAGSSGK